MESESESEWERRCRVRGRLPGWRGRHRVRRALSGRGRCAGTAQLALTDWPSSRGAMVMSMVSLERCGVGYGRRDDNDDDDGSGTLVWLGRYLDQSSGKSLVTSH